MDTPLGGDAHSPSDPLRHAVRSVLPLSLYTRDLGEEGVNASPAGVTRVGVGWGEGCGKSLAWAPSRCSDLLQLRDQAPFTVPALTTVLQKPCLRPCTGLSDVGAFPQPSRELEGFSSSERTIARSERTRGAGVSRYSKDLALLRCLLFTTRGRPFLHHLPKRNLLKTQTDCYPNQAKLFDALAYFQICEGPTSFSYRRKEWSGDGV